MCTCTCCLRDNYIYVFYQQENPSSISQPSWVVDRSEIILTDKVLGIGGWGTVKVATFRGLSVAAKCIHQKILSKYNIALFKV